MFQVLVNLKFKWFEAGTVHLKKVLLNSFFMLYTNQNLMILESTDDARYGVALRPLLIKSHPHSPDQAISLSVNKNIVNNR